MSTWLYIDFNSFFASCEQQEQPHLRNRPMAVVPMQAENTSVIAASYPAKAFGVKTGTKVFEARKMCPGIIFVKGHHRLYTHYHHRLREVIETVYPIHSICSIDEIACELTGSHQRPEKILQLIQDIKQVIRSDAGECLTCSIGVGPNRFIAKVAADMKKPDGQTIIEKSELPQRLFELKLRDLPGIGWNMEKRLNAQKIHTVESLCALSESQMRGIWGGVVGARYFQLLRGEGFHTVHQKNKSIGHEHVLAPLERSSGGALLVAQKLLHKAGLRVRKEGLTSQALRLTVKFMDQTYFEKEARFHQTQDASFLAGQIISFWREFPVGKKPLKVSIVLTHLHPVSEMQMSFFERKERQDLFQIVDRINDKFGKDTVYPGHLHGSLKGTAPTRIAFSRIPDLEEFD